MQSAASRPRRCRSAAETEGLRAQVCVEPIREMDQQPLVHVPLALSAELDAASREVGGVPRDGATGAVRHAVVVWIGSSARRSPCSPEAPPNAFDVLACP